MNAKILKCVKKFLQYFFVFVKFCSYITFTGSCFPSQNHVLLMLMFCTSNKYIFCTGYFFNNCITANSQKGSVSHYKRNKEIDQPSHLVFLWRWPTISSGWKVGCNGTVIVVTFKVEKRFLNKRQKENFKWLLF